MAIALVYSVASGPDVPGRSAGILASIVAGLLPFLIGTVALGSAAIVTVLEYTREESRIAIEASVEAIVSRLDALKTA